MIALTMLTSTEDQEVDVVGDTREIQHDNKVAKQDNSLPCNKTQLHNAEASSMSATKTNPPPSSLSPVRPAGTDPAHSKEGPP